MQNALIHAFQSDSLPCNPIPFARGLADYVRDRDSNAIKSDEAKAILWILLAQAYGQFATIDVGDEWRRLDAALRPADDGGRPIGRRQP